METEPHVIGMYDLAALLEEQEKIGKTLKKETEEMNTFILNEVLEQKPTLKVEVKIQTAEQGNQVCFLIFLNYFLIKKTLSYQELF